MKDISSIESLRHSLAHLLAAAVLELYPDAKNAIGPAVEHGFYYDFEFEKTKPTEVDLPRIEQKMRELLPSWGAFERIEETPSSARKRYAHNPYKQELIVDIDAKGEPITSYQSGDFVDLCRGGHITTAQDIDPHAFTLTHLAGAYWRGDEKNAMLTRIYGLAFFTAQELTDHQHMIEEAKKRDHKKLGPELDLFVFSDLVGPGLPLWTPRGTTVRHTLDNFVWELRKKAGYQKVEIPHITKKELYERSGHWDKFKDELFRIHTREHHEFAMKPMNCPHHTQIYARKLWSYRELPQRYCNTTMCYRDEQTGELSGLSRLRSFAQDDAHVFCRMSQSKEEFLKVWDIVHQFYHAFGFQMRVRLSLHDSAHPEKYLGDTSTWATAEHILREIVEEKKADWFEGIGEAAFYGPKLDFMAKDSLGREWQVATIQLDMNMPERFDLVCVNEKGERERIVMIHAAIMGSIERFLSIAIEHFAGAFPVWFAPVQVAVVPVSEKHDTWAHDVARQLSESDIRIEILNGNDTLGKRIREAEGQKIPYVLVVGDKEIAAQSVAVRKRGVGDTGAVPLSDFRANLAQEIKHRT